jgi:acid stress chaperone HdeB
MRIPVIAAAIVLGLSSTPAAQAQVTLDVSKITWDQYVHSKIATPNYIAAWMSGYFNAKRGNTMLDLQTFQGNINKVERFCYEETNFQMPLMQAIERVLGP